MIAALTPHEIVNLLVDDDETEQAVRSRCSAAAASRIHFHHLQTVDSWIRDYGPNFLLGSNGEGAFNDWIFNAWGNKYEVLKKDDTVPQRLESFLKMKRFSPEIVMEGGSIEVNGAGCVLTTEQCLLNPNRNPALSREEIERYLKDYLGVTKVLWLGEGIVGDDTDGHIDDIARFAASDVIVCAVEEDPQDANYEILQDNLERLRSMTGASGKPFEIVTLPMPGIVGGSSTTLAISNVYRRATQTFTSPTTSFSLRSLVMQTINVRSTRFNDSSLLVRLCRLTASHWSGEWARSIASRNSNRRFADQGLINPCLSAANDFPSPPR